MFGGVAGVGYGDGSSLDLVTQNRVVGQDWSGLGGSDKILNGINRAHETHSGIDTIDGHAKHGGGRNCRKVFFEPSGALIEKEAKNKESW